MRRFANYALFLGWVIYLFATGNTDEVESKSKSSENQNILNDVQRCLRTFDKDTLNLYEALPGYGWDNLQNRFVGNMVKLKYSQCKTTDDGRFLIPDNVYAIPKKSSKLKIFGEMFDHWTNFTSTTSSSINVKSGLHIGDFGIDGKYSKESETIRRHQVQDKSITTRVQARYVRYTAKLQPDSSLDGVFKRRLKKIAMHLQVNKTDMAQYESQLLVRDFGTHVISSVDGGAVIAKIDHIDSSFVGNGVTSKKVILAAASISFPFFDPVNISFANTATNQDISSYLRNRIQSEVETYGGPIYKPGHFTLDDWASGIDADLVPIDRAGEPIYYLITPQSLPNVPSSIIFPLISNVKVAVEQYYKFNIYRGCTKVDSPEFSYMANVDDGSCSSQRTNYKFGGVFQMCEKPKDFNKDLCFGLEQKNPLTGSFSCNSDNYYPVLLHQGKRQGAERRSTCKKCGLFHRSRCCTDYTVYGSATFSAYWCVARGSVPQQSGFMFGGIYTATIPNPLTRSQSCPHYFHALRLGRSISVCVSDEFEMGFEYAIPFSGFFSCEAGNPLAIETKSQNYSFKDSVDSSLMNTYLKNSDPRYWPKRCPSGYSMHLAAVEDDCEIHYCVKVSSFPRSRPPPLRMPPFIELPTDAYVGDSVSKEFVINEKEQEWTLIEDGQTVDNDITEYSGSLKEQSKTVPNSSQHELSKGEIAGIGVGCFLAGILVVVVIKLSFRRLGRKNKHKKIQYSGSDLLGNADPETLIMLETEEFQN